MTYRTRSKYGVFMDGKVIPSERDVLKACMDYLATIPNSRFYRRNTGASALSYKGRTRYIRYGKKGMADVWGVWNGIHVEIEVKRPGEKPNVDQEAWLHDCRAVGCIAFWVDSVDALMMAVRQYGVIGVMDAPLRITEV